VTTTVVIAAATSGRRAPAGSCSRKEVVVTVGRGA
jgi:hypothetical protein